MARPRVFLSSTFYDLRHIRSSLEKFVDHLGYEAVVSEKGKIAYDPDLPLDESCYREAAAADIFVLIIGGRYGSAASDENIEGHKDFYDRYESITKREYDAATKQDIPTYILVDRSVYGEYETYIKNRKNEEIEYAHVESVSVFRFIDEILAKRRNNPVFQFDHHSDMEEWLRDQWAGLFREFIHRRAEQKQLASLSDRVAELSNLNASLQRYLEEIISRVSRSPEEAQGIINAEKTRMDQERRLREFFDNKIVMDLVNSLDVSKSDAERVLRDATDFDDLARLFVELIPHLNLDKMLDAWRTDSEVTDEINRARCLLDLPPLQFVSDDGTPG